MVSLKFFFLFFMIGMAMATRPVPKLEEMLEDRKACRKIYPVTEKEIDDLHANICPENADRLLKCYTRCYIEKLGGMSADGKFDVERIRDVINVLFKKTLKKDPLDTLKECTKKRNEHCMCERAYAAVKCVGDKKLW